MKSDDVFARVQELSGVATLGSAVMQILAVAQNPDSTAEEVAAVVSRDPAVYARVLQVVNSPFYGFNRQIEGIEDAIVLLGFSEVERLALAVAVINRFREKTARANRLKQLWLHSLVCAIASEAYAEVFAPPGLNRKEVYSSAFLHDIGKAIICQEFPEEFQLIQTYVDGGEIPENEAEAEVLDGLNHTNIGAWAAGNWELPSSIVQSIQLHHSPEEFTAETPLAEKVHAGNALCYLVKIPAILKSGGTPGAIEPVPADLARNERLITTFKQRYEAKRRMLQSIAG